MGTPQTIADAAIAGVPLIFVVVGLVQLLKSIQVDGAWLRVASMVIGLVIGGAYMLTQLPADPAPGWADYFAAVVFGLGLGVVAFGAYDAAKAVTAAAVRGAIQTMTDPNTEEGDALAQWIRGQAIRVKEINERRNY